MKSNIEQLIKTILSLGVIFVISLTLAAFTDAEDKTPAPEELSIAETQTEIPADVQPMPDEAIAEPEAGAAPEAEILTDAAIDAEAEAAPADESEPEGEPGLESEPVSEFIPDPNLSIDYITKVRASYIMSVNKEISEETATYLAQLFEKFASTRDYIDTETLMGIARLESTYRFDSGENYVGLMQVSLKYGTKAGYTEEQLREPECNLEYAVGVLDGCHAKFPDSLTYALLAYNKGYYALKAKIDAGEEIKTTFADTVYKYADEIRALY